jgi:hypothetical protein
MNRAWLMLFPLCLSLFLPAVSPARAALSKDETNLARESARLEKTATAPQGDSTITARIVKDFGIDTGRIAILRERGMSFGDIITALSLSQALPGGTSEENVAQVLTIRTGPPQVEWNAVAQRVGAKLGKAVSRIRKINNDALMPVWKVSASRGLFFGASPSARNILRFRTPVPPFVVVFLVAAIHLALTMDREVQILSSFSCRPFPRHRLAGRLPLDTPFTERPGWM